ncbi:unnamed protein product [Prorocentrum cordatum]|uniref:Uncharacterized protein n=1 Tax=Prorocentrum cordatum TaxID=2364126 RepID=A0ABN9SIY6_9DINO|nr:unnamed protein product [Polarella glacialis]
MTPGPMMARHRSGHGPDSPFTILRCQAEADAEGHVPIELIMQDASRHLDDAGAASSAVEPVIMAGIAALLQQPLAPVTPAASDFQILSGSLNCKVANLGEFLQPLWETRSVIRRASAPQRYGREAGKHA